MLDITIDPIKALSSITGITGLTVLIVGRLKVWLGGTKYLRDVPVLVYSLVVSLALTVLSHSVLHTISGELPQLLLQAVVQVLLASGALSIAEGWNKKIGETSAALDAHPPQLPPPSRRRRVSMVLLACALAGSSVACANALVQADRAAHRAISFSQDNADALCDAELLNPESCAGFNAKLVPVLEAYDRFNRAVRADSAVEIPAIVRALHDLAAAAAEFLPADLRKTIRDRVDEALVIATRAEAK